MKNKIEIHDAEAFDDAFADVGRRVRPRTNGRTHDEKEWYVLRRFLKCALLKGYFKCPVRICKAKPPRPDFRIDLDGIATWIEITEATSEADQKEMTNIEKSDTEVIVNGELGGRYADGAFGNRPERDWAADVLRAIRRKRRKTIFAGNHPSSHLVIYVNSTPGILIDENEAFARLFKSLERVKASVRRLVNGAFVHVVGKRQVCIDVFDARVFVDREFEPYQFAE